MHNVELLNEVHKVIKEHPDRHSQSTWVSGDTADHHPQTSEIRAFAHTDPPSRPVDENRPICRTRACVAGWAAILAAPEGTYIATPSDLRLPDGTHTAISMYAAEAFGIDGDIAEWLFEPYRSRTQILWALQWLAENPSARSAQFFRNCRLFEAATP